MKTPRTQELSLSLRTEEHANYLRKRELTAQLPGKDNYSGATTAKLSTNSVV